MPPLDRSLTFPVDKELENDDARASMIGNGAFDLSKPMLMDHKALGSGYDTNLRQLCCCGAGRCLELRSLWSQSATVHKEPLEQECSRL